MSKHIPESARTTVKQRARFRCERCGVPTATGEVHHRRSRSVVDSHRHCPCNLVYLCGTCHRWAHGYPFMARDTGWIISRYTEEPSTVPYSTVRGHTFNDCSGGMTH